jgi:hypothetical protein
MAFQPSKVSHKKAIRVVQRNFTKGYVSVLQANRVPNNALTDMTNMDLIQDSIVKPRQSTVAVGPTALGTIIGIGTFTKLNAGVPERWQITMQVIGGVGKIVTNKDGGAWATVGGTYNAAAWCQFTQSNVRVYVSNATDTMSYYDIVAGTIVTYTALAAPATPTLAQTGLTGTNQTYYYGITANNNVGETAIVISAAITVSKLRNQWTPASNNITVTGTAVTGALSYNIYISQTANIADFEYLQTVQPGTGAAPSFIDDSSTQINIYKSASPGDSTAGPKLSYLISDNGQLFGVGDPSNVYNMWYSGKGQHSGDFSPFNGGGYAYINYGGDSLPSVVKSFRDGKGNPVVTVLTRGQAGAGKFYHAQATSTTYGTTVIPFFDVYEANGQSGTISPFGVVEANNNIYYPTGDNFKSTGSLPNIFNILGTQSVSMSIDPDVRALNLKAMSKCVGLFYRERIFWAVPNGTSTNSEIWVLDLARSSAWILRWTVPADWLWLYEDNTGVTHLCALVNNVIVEFTSNVQTQDQGIAFHTRVATGSLVWDNSGVSLAAVQTQYYNLLYPKGNIYVNDYGVGADGGDQYALASQVFVGSSTTSFTGFGTWDYSGLYKYGDDVGFVGATSHATANVILEPDETLNQLSGEILTVDANVDYTLSTITTVATAIPAAYVGT